MDRYQYLLLMGACLVVTLPLELVLGAAGVAAAAAVAAALWLPVVVFVVWDVAAIARDHWSYSPPVHDGMDAAVRVPGRGARVLPRDPDLRVADPGGRPLAAGSTVGPVPEYTVAAVGRRPCWSSPLEVLWLRTGLFRDRTYWIAMAIVFFFQVLVDGWLTKLSAPIVLYNPDRVQRRPDPLGRPVEDYLFGFALVTLVMLLWERAGRTLGDRSIMDRSAAAFVAMEAVSYLAHRFVMHGPGMGLHRSHHRRVRASRGSRPTTCSRSPSRR